MELRDMDCENWKKYRLDSHKGVERRMSRKESAGAMMALRLP